MVIQSVCSTCDSLNHLAKKLVSHLEVSLDRIPGRRRPTQNRLARTYGWTDKLQLKYTKCLFYVYITNKLILALLVFRQALRLPRAIRLVPPLKRFCLKIFGSGLKLLVVFLIVAVFLIWFAIVSMQLFGYLDTEDECSRFGNDQFGNIFKVCCSYCYLVMIASIITSDMLGMILL